MIAIKNKLLTESAKGYGSVLMLLLLPLLLISCREEAEDVVGRLDDHSVIEMNGYTVPVFSTAEEQLNYTRSWFADIEEKRTALLAFISLYPGEKVSCGLVRLDLAYLELGGDYRLAREHACFAAIKEYKNVLREYADHPEIMAKAYWYIGWIYADLLHDREKGIQYYRRVVQDCPDIEVSLLSPAPWVSIIYPDDETLQSALKQPPENYWAALALLEMVRHSIDDEEAWDAFVALWEKYRSTIATGFGLKLILERRVHSGEALDMARQFMETNFSNVHILGDIQKQINGLVGLRGGM